MKALFFTMYTRHNRETLGKDPRQTDLGYILNQNGFRKGSKNLLPHRSNQNFHK